MASAVYNSYKVSMLNGGINLSTGPLYVALCTDSYTPNIATDTYWSTPQANEVTGTAYVAGGAALTGLSVTQDNTNNRGIFTAGNASWVSSTITARYAVIYLSTGVASTSPLIAYIDFGSNQSSTVGNFVINWNVTNGILTVS